MELFKLFPAGWLLSRQGKYISHLCAHSVMYYSVLVYHGLPFYSAKSELPASTTLAVSTTPVVKGASEEIVKQLKDELSVISQKDRWGTENGMQKRYLEMRNVYRWQVWSWKLIDWRSLKDFDDDKLLALYYDLTQNTEDLYVC